jgi:hypothetical protein
MYKITTKISVSGISPCLKEVMEARTINAKTIPEAPNKLQLQIIAFTTPVINAVEAITMRIFLLPYFSSNMDPSTRKSIILPIRCSHDE